MGKFLGSQLLWRLGMRLKNKLNMNPRQISYKQPTPYTPVVKSTTTCY
jgi:hypothetical protein